MIKGKEKKQQPSCVVGIHVRVDSRHFTDSCFPLANNGRVRNEPMQSCNIVERNVRKECEKRMATKNSHRHGKSQQNINWFDLFFLMESFLMIKILWILCKHSIRSILHFVAHFNFVYSGMACVSVGPPKKCEKYEIVISDQCGPPMAISLLWDDRWILFCVAFSVFHNIRVLQFFNVFSFCKT